MGTLVKQGDGAQVRRLGAKGWTKAKRAVFLETLAATCNASMAARAAGLSARGAHYLRRRDGNFALLWAQAIEHGTELLQEALMSRALGHGGGDENPDFEPVEGVGPDFDPKLAMDVLKMQAGALRPRKAGTPPAQVVIDLKVLERLEALSRTLARP
jgi:hypothetical protein